MLETKTVLGPYQKNNTYVLLFFVGKHEDNVSTGFIQEPFKNQTEETKRCEDDQNQGKASDIGKDLSAKLYAYGLILSAVIVLELLVNGTNFQQSTNDLTSQEDRFYDTNRQMFFGSLARCVFSAFIIFFANTYDFHVASKHLDIIRYIIFLVYYLGYCQILACFLLDSEKSDFNFDYSYCVLLIFNAVCVTDHLIVALFTWRDWKKKVQLELSKKKGNNQNQEDQDSKQNISKDNNTHDDDDEESSKRTVPILVLIKKCLGWYRGELFGIGLGYILMAFTATSKALLRLVVANFFMYLLRLSIQNSYLIWALQ